jgi:hypothetical protein
VPVAFDPFGSLGRRVKSCHDVRPWEVVIHVWKEVWPVHPTGRMRIRETANFWVFQCRCTSRILKRCVENEDLPDIIIIHTIRNAIDDLERRLRDTTQDSLAHSIIDREIIFSNPFSFPLARRYCLFYILRCSRISSDEFRRVSEI